MLTNSLHPFCFITKNSRRLCEFFWSWVVRYPFWGRCLSLPMCTPLIAVLQLLAMIDWELRLWRLDAVAMASPTFSGIGHWYLKAPLRASCHNISRVRYEKDTIGKKWKYFHKYLGIDLICFYFYSFAGVKWGNCYRGGTLKWRTW